MRFFFGMVFLAVGFFQPSLSHAECDAPVDLRRGVAAKLPSGNQGDSYLCGFFSAATLLDSYRMRENGSLDSLPIDPVALAIDLAIEANRPRWLPFQLTTDALSVESGRRGSLLCNIIDHVSDSGVCDHRDVRVFDREWMGKRSNQAVDIYALLDEYADLSESDQSQELSALVSKVLPLLRVAPSGPDSKEEVTRILWENRDAPYRAIRALLYPSCADHRIEKAFSNLPECTAEWFPGLSTIGIGTDRARAGRLARSIHESLEEPAALPIPVAHCYQVLHEGRSYRKSNPFESECILHYVSVMGRRKKDGVCQFLVRNSYDPKDENAVSKDWERDGEDFWVDAEPFSRSAFGLHWLED